MSRGSIFGPQQDPNQSPDFNQKAQISCTLPHGELLLQVWVCLDDPGRFYSRSRTGSRHNLRRGGGLQHSYIGFQDDTRGRRHFVGFAWGHRLCLAQSVRRLKASGGDQLAAKVGCLPQLVRLGLGTIRSGGMVCNTHTSDFRTTQEAIHHVQFPELSV